MGWSVDEKAFYKKWWFIVVVIVLVISVFVGNGGKNDEAIAAKELKERLTKQIATLEKRAMREKQPRRKWELAEEVRRLKAELGSLPGSHRKQPESRA